MLKNIMLKNFAGAAAIALTATFAAGTSDAASIDLGFVLDGSGSVEETDYASAAQALSNAIGLIPTSGANTYRIAVTGFGGGQVTIVAPIVLTAANLASVQSAVATSTKATGGTDTAGAISYITDLFVNDGGLGDTSLINITTDGSPNSQNAAENAALAAYNGGIDGISFEAVGTGVSSAIAQDRMARIAGLGTSGDADTGVIVSDLSAIPNAATTGFVIPVADFAAYGAAIEAKIGQIVEDTGGQIPLPAGLPLLLTGFGVLALVRRRAAA